MDFMTNVYTGVFLGKRKYSLKLWKVFTETFNAMPIAAII